MTPTLERELRLLDLLASLPQTPEAPPTAADLRARLTEVCMTQGIRASRDEIERTVAHYLEQQALDARLLALLQEGPATQGDSIEALRRRLEQRRVEANVPATPESIQRAIATYQAQTTPFPLWDRPITESDRQEALLVYRTRTRKNDERFSIVGVTGLSMALFGMLGIGIGRGNQSVTWLDWSIGLFTLGLGLGTVGLMVTEILKMSATTPWGYRKWFGVPAYENLPLARMADLENVTPDLDRMQRWLGNAQARDALQQLSKTLVPITRQDAAYLDSYVAQVQAQKDQQDRQATQRAWKEGLDQMRQG